MSRKTRAAEFEQPDKVRELSKVLLRTENVWQAVARENCS